MTDVRATTDTSLSLTPPGERPKAKRPYLGLTSFRDTPEDRALFFGRSSEQKELLDLILSETLVVLFGKSGLGKSSLINAGLLERLRDERYFPVAARVNDTQAGPSKSVLHGVERAAAAQGVAILGARSDDLWSFFSQTQIVSGDRVLRPVLIIDQFEELFTAYPRDSADVALFVERLADLVRRRVPETIRSDVAARLATLTDKLIQVEARPKSPANEAELRQLAEQRARLLPQLYEDVGPDVKVVLVIREDYVPELHSLRSRIPGILRNSLRLEPFTLAQAREAIEGPATAPVEYDEGRMTFAPGVVDALLEELRTHDVGGRQIKDNRIEPLQLQILCRFLYERHSGSEPMTTTKFKRAGGQFQAITNYYEGVVKTFRRVRPGPSEATWPWFDNLLFVHFPRSAIRRLCEAGLIDAGGFRTSKNAPVVKARYGISDADLDELVEQRLLNREPRLAAPAYELAHDSLVNPLHRLRAERRLRRTGGVALVGIVMAAAWIVYQSVSARRTLENDRAALFARRIAFAQLVENRANLSDIALEGIDLSHGYFAGAKLAGARIGGSTLDSSTFDSTAFRGAQLLATTARFASFADADFRDARIEALANNASFARADLRKAAISGVFDDAEFSGAVLDSATISNASMRGANMRRTSTNHTTFVGTAWWLAHGWSDDQFAALQREAPLAAFVQSPAFRERLRLLAVAIDSARAQRDTGALIAALARRARFLVTASDSLIGDSHYLDTAYADTRHAFRLLGDSTGALLDIRGYILLRRVWGRDSSLSDHRRQDALDHFQRALKRDGGKDSATIGEHLYHIGLAYQAFYDLPTAKPQFERAERYGYQPTYEQLFTFSQGAQTPLPKSDASSAVPDSTQTVVEQQPTDTSTVILSPELMGEAKRDSSLESLYPETAAKVQKLLDEARRAGLTPIVHETYRSPALQKSYYDRGRTVRPPYSVVTNAPYFSPHWCRVAVEIIDEKRAWDMPPEWFKRLGEIAKSVGLRWAGDDRFPDLPHFDDPAAVRAPCRVSTDGHVIPPTQLSASKKE